MSDHNFTVQQPKRTISFEIDADDAHDAFIWLHEAKDALGADVVDHPMIIKELYGGLRAIAENRPYGGH